MLDKLFKVSLCLLLLLPMSTQLTFNEPVKVKAEKAEEVPVNGTIMQYFEWFLPDDGQHWQRLENDAAHLDDMGITSVWIPPAYKGHVGSNDVGYGVYDLYDLGEFNQKGSVRTKYGTKDQLKNAVDQLHANDVQVYGDVVVNHLMGADDSENVQVVEVNPSNRNEEISGEYEREAWTAYNYEARGDKYSSFKWRSHHFDGIDNYGEIYRFSEGSKGWDEPVSHENGNYDYLMGTDLDFDHPEVVEEIKNWGVWYTNEVDLDGFRLDAVKHIKHDFMKDFVKHVRTETGKEMFSVGEYIGNKNDLQQYLNTVDGEMSLFDFTLRHKFADASSSNGNFDLRNLNQGTITNENPTLSVPFVENHDTQPDRDDAHANEVLPWFKPLAYAYILTREQGYPQVFYGDYYGTNGTNGNKIAPMKDQLDPMLLARKNNAYGEQHDYLDNSDMIGWTREGVDSKPGSGLATLMTDRSGGSKEMYVGTQHAGDTWVDVTGNVDEEIIINSSGNGNFKVSDESVSIWIPKDDQSNDDDEENISVEAPNNVQVNANNSQVEITWSSTLSDEDVENFEIYRDGELLTKTKEKSFVDDTVKEDTSYSYKVRVIDKSGNKSSFSKEVMVEVGESTEEDNDDENNEEPTPNDPSDLENKPFTWDNANVYFVITDRFQNGNPNNDNSYGRPQTDDWGTNIGTFHGGDIKGLTEKLEDGYFTELGTNAIWITAPWEQMHGWVGGKDGDFAHYGYHGYYGLDFTAMDRNIGTVAEMREFVNLAHEKGIRVVMDVVMNHVAYPTLVDMEEFGYGDRGGLSGDWTPDRNQGQNWHTHNDIMNTNNASAWANWWGSDWIRADNTAGYDNCGNNDLKLCVGFLPDIKTDVTNEVDLPPILKNKWNNEGNSNDNWVVPAAEKYRQNMNIAPKDYMTNWLSAWVEEFGIDGFRVDTAKHVEVDRWKDLKNQTEEALHTWREENPDSPGAQWDDEFWMTAEVYGHGLGKNEYFDNGFDSVINFDFQDANMNDWENLFSRYAREINTDANFNMLSYISSHDTQLYNRGNLVNAGTALLLLPGGIQTFYGDETARPLGEVGSDPEQGTRSSMNWDNINKDVLSHWQKIGKFRNDHPAVGAGQHQQIESSPYTFTRTYETDELFDQVVIALGVNGTTTIDVGNVFSEGEEIRDAYTDKKLVVSNGQVTVDADSKGVILLERTSDISTNMPKISASEESGSFKTDNLTVTLNVENAEIAKYTLDGSDPNEGTEYTNGTDITFGDNAEFGETITLKLYAENEDAQRVKTYEYTKRDPDALLEVYFKKPEAWSAPHIYYFETDPKENEPIWDSAPEMNDQGNGWYMYQFENAESAQVIFKDNAGNQTPGQEQPGFEVTETSWYDGEKWHVTDPREPAEPPSVPTDLSVTDFNHNSVTLNWSASDGDVKEYQVFRDDESVGTTTETTFVDEGLEAETSYHYKLKAVGMDGEATEATDTVEITTAEQPDSNLVTIYYKQGFDTPYVHYRPEGGTWTNAPGLKMEDSEIEGYKQLTLDIGTAERAEVAFNNGRGHWDSNNESNYFFEVGDNTYDAGTVTPGKPNEPVEGNKVTIYYKQGFDTPYVHYRPEGGIWTNAPGIKMEDSEIEGYKQLTLDIGTATRAEVAFNNGRGHWDSDNERNYFFEVGDNTYVPGENGAGGQVEIGKKP